MGNRPVVVAADRRRQPRGWQPPLARARHRVPRRLDPTLRRCCVCTATPPGAMRGRASCAACIHELGSSPSTNSAWATANAPASRRYADRVRDLDDVVVALQIASGSPLVVAAHDWGGAIAMGWAVQDPHQIAGLILCNTGIAVPDGRSAPGIIRLAASPLLLDCRLPRHIDVRRRHGPPVGSPHLQDRP